MDDVISQIRACNYCEEQLQFGARPVLAGSKKSKIVIIGQAPGIKVHKSGVPWDDKSGDKLRDWLGVDSKTFYNEDNFAILPMGFCYPGKAKTGDLPPMKVCAPMWHQKVWDFMESVELTLLIGRYAQDYYLPKDKKINLTNKVKDFHLYLPKYFVLPHSSPLNNIWRSKNRWFEEEIVPILKNRVQEILR